MYPSLQIDHATALRGFGPGNGCNDEAEDEDEGKNDEEVNGGVVIMEEGGSADDGGMNGVRDGEMCGECTGLVR